MGLPTSEDIKTESIFEKAKNAPGKQNYLLQEVVNHNILFFLGSPFLNQPFDHEGKI